MFVDEWVTTPNYSIYFQNCNPSTCTYTITDKINYSYAITLFISLYGGLIMLLRLISPLIIKTISKFSHRQTNRISLVSCKMYLQRLNLFKKSDKRTDDDIKQQKITTRVYLILLLITITVLLLFNSFDTQTVTISISNPSLETYIDLQQSYSHTLRCPCSTMTISYHKFMKFSPVLHQVCSSDFTTQKWLTILEQTIPLYIEIDWRNRAYGQFSLLSKLCQLANETVRNAIDHFLLQSFVVSNMLTETDFDLQLGQNFEHLYQSTTIYFSHLINATDLHIQIDQPYMTKHIESPMTVTFSSIEFLTTLIAKVIMIPFIRK